MGCSIRPAPWADSQTCMSLAELMFVRLRTNVNYASDMQVWICTRGHTGSRACKHQQAAQWLADQNACGSLRRRLVHRHGHTTYWLLTL
jgi:hypothetical protein